MWQRTSHCSQKHYCTANDVLQLLHHLAMLLPAHGWPADQRIWGCSALQSGPHESYSLKAMESEFREHPDLMFTWAVTSAFTSKFSSGQLQRGQCASWSGLLQAAAERSTCEVPVSGAFRQWTLNRGFSLRH